MNLSSYHFKEQEEGEEILHVIHRHWFNIAIQFFPLLLALFVIIMGLTYAPALFGGILSPATYWFIASFLVLCLWLVASVIWVDYYLDVWIVTNLRVVNIEQKGLFLREVSELRYHKIQDITTEVHGLIPTLLNYGDVFIQTAGEEPRFLFHNIPDPYKIKGELVMMQKRSRKEELAVVKEVIRGNDEGSIG